MTGGEPTKLKVFVSYAREDLGFADQLVDALQVAGFDPLIDRHRMTGGEEFKGRLALLILECDTVCFVVTPDSIDPQSFCNWEIAETDRLQKRMIPVLCRSLGEANVPPRLKALDYIHFYPDVHVPGSGFGNGLARLTKALKADLAWLREHTVLGERAARWDTRGRGDEHLLRGKLLDEAERMLADRPSNAPEFTQTQRDYLRESRRAEDASIASERQRLADMQAAHEERERALADAEAAVAERNLEQQKREHADKRRQRLRYLLAAVSAAAVIGLGGFSYFLTQKTKEAVTEKRRADDQTAVAETKTKEAEAALAKADDALDSVKVEKARTEQLFLMQSRFLMAKAEEALNDKDYATAALLTLEGLPDKEAGNVRPELEGLVNVLRTALRGLNGDLVAADDASEDLDARTEDLIVRARAKLPKCLTVEQRKAFALEGSDVPRWCLALRLPDAPGDATSHPPTPPETKDKTSSDDELPVRETASEPTTAMPSSGYGGAGVLFGAQNVGFAVDTDVIQVSNDVGKFDRIRFRVLNSDVYMRSFKVVYDTGEADTLEVNAEIPKNSRTNWINVRGDRFIRKVEMAYRAKPDFAGQMRIEAFGEYAEGWLGAQGEGRKYNQGWILLGAQSASFVGFDKDVISVGPNAGGFSKIRIAVRDRALTLNELRIVYADGSDETIPVRARVEAGATFGPIDLKSEKRAPIDRIEGRYRSRFFDPGKGQTSSSVIEVWGQY